MIGEVTSYLQTPSKTTYQMPHPVESWSRSLLTKSHLELCADERGEPHALVPARAVHDDGVALREPLALQQPQQRLVAEIVLCSRTSI